MDNVPYREWGEYIHSMLCEKGVKEGLVLDLGCGTGTMTEILAGYGYDMIGVDDSEDMLELAMDKRLKSGHDIREFTTCWKKHLKRPTTLCR